MIGEEIKSMFSQQPEYLNVGARSLKEAISRITISGVMYPNLQKALEQKREKACQDPWTWPTKSWKNPGTRTGE
jgi:hypothetical protein